VTSSTPFRIVGALDGSTGPSTIERLTAFAERTTGDVIIDCSEMTSLDAAGITTLNWVEARIGAGRRLVLTNVAPQCLRPQRFEQTVATLDAYSDDPLLTR